MFKYLFIVLIFASAGYSINPFSYFWNIKLSGDTATVAKWKNNNDSVKNWSSRICDTVNKSIPRWSAFSNHDSTFKWMNIDTIPSADSINVKKLKVDKVDSIYCPNGINAARLNISGVTNTDSLKSARGVNAPNFYGNLVGGSVSGTTGTFSGVANVDSLKTTKGINATVGIFTGRVGIGTNSPTNKLSIDESTSGNCSQAITARGGNTLRSELYFGTKDSGGFDIGCCLGSNGALGGGLALKGSTAGITTPDMFVSSNSNIGIGTTTPSSKLSVNGGVHVGGDSDAGDNNLLVDGVASVDSLKSTKGITGTKITGTVGSFSSTVTVDSLYSSKGIRIASGKKIYTDSLIGNVRGDVSATTGTFSSTVSVDSLRCTKGIRSNGMEVVRAGTFLCSLMTGASGTTFLASGTAQYAISGKICMIRFPYLNGTITNNNAVLKGFPIDIQYYSDFASHLIRVAGSTNEIGYIQRMSSGDVTIVQYTSSGLNNGNGGLPGNTMVNLLMP